MNLPETHLKKILSPQIAECTLWKGKFIFLLILTIYSSSFSYGQCTADAGKDRHWCGESNDFGGYTLTGDSAIILGGDPAVINGNPPYTYRWFLQDTSYQGESASFYLNDTTASNPLMVNLGGTDFVLEVQDSSGALCRDTVKVGVSSLISTFVSYDYDLRKGDTIQLEGPNVYPVLNSIVQLDIDSILWRPNHGLIDSTAINPVISPEHDISYYPVIRDSFGCEFRGWPFQHVYVQSTGIDNGFEQGKDYFNVYPTILSNDNDLKVKNKIPENERKNTRFTLYNSSGKRALELFIKDVITYVNTESLTSGTYIYLISQNQFPLQKGKIIIY